MTANAYLSEEERATLEVARIGVAGAGGLGSNCAAHLVRAGIRHLVIADFDTVNESNLNRQFFFRDQVGRKKIDALRENLLRIEPGLELKMHDMKLDSTNVPALFATCDIVAEAFDSAASKSMLLNTLLPSGKRVVAVSGIAGWGNSNAIAAKRIGTNLVMIGDLHTGVDPTAGIYPASPRVGVAAAMQANSIVAWLLKQKI